MKKENHNFSRLIELTSNLKILLILGCILSAIGSVLTLGPFCLYLLHNQGDIDGRWKYKPGEYEFSNRYGWSALIFAILGILFTFAALMCTHVVAFKTVKKVR